MNAANGANVEVMFKSIARVWTEPHRCADIFSNLWSSYRSGKLNIMYHHRPASHFNSDFLIFFLFALINETLCLFVDSVPVGSRETAISSHTVIHAYNQCGLFCNFIDGQQE